MQHQLDGIYWHTKKIIHKMPFFVVFIYLKAWFISPFLTSAAGNDLELYRNVVKFKKNHTNIFSNTCTFLNRHSPHLVPDGGDDLPLPVQNEDIPTKARPHFAKNIHRQAASGELEIQKSTLLLITEKSGIHDFVGERCRLLFDLLDGVHCSEKLIEEPHSYHRQYR